MKNSSSSNQQQRQMQKQAAIANAVAQTTEAAIEHEIDKYDALLNDDSALEQLRQRRIRELQHAHQQRQRYQSLGHGAYGDLAAGPQSKDAARAFFEATKQSPRCVIHFYRSTSARLCEVVDKHLAILAPKHVETRFARISVDAVEQEGAGSSTSNGTAYLCEKLGIVVIPTLLLVKDRNAVHQIRGFDELGGTDEFATRDLEMLLSLYGMVDAEDPVSVEEYREQIARRATASGAHGGGGGGVHRVSIRRVAGGGGSSATAAKPSYDDEN